MKTVARDLRYQALFERVERDSRLAVQLADFHVGLAGIFCSEPSVQRVAPDASLWLHDGFTRKLTEWLSSLRWYPSSGGGWTGISALELLWQFIFDTVALPPFWYEGRWQTVDDHALDGFVLPPVRSLYRVWVKHLAACEGLPERLDGAPSLAALGASFGGFSCAGRVPLSPAVVDDLLVLFRHRSGLGALRFPAFWSYTDTGSAAHTSWSAVGSANGLFAMSESVHTHTYIYIYVCIYIYILIYIYIHI